MPFIPHTEDDIAQMLAAIGARSIDELFDEIPAALRARGLGNIPSGLSELEVTRLMQDAAELDRPLRCFAGAGAYEHHIPAAVWQLVSRGEFYTAYTPYQAEASQGTLQLLYEYQSMVTALTAMDASNASLYDGASALAEAVLMAVRAHRKSKSKRILMPKSVHPHYRQVAHAIVKNQGIELVEIGYDPATGQIDQAQLKGFEGTDVTALVIPQPNFFGALEEVDTLTDWAHAHNMLVIGLVNPVALALLSPPGEWGETGADIVCGDGQPLGIPLSWGGPYFGFMCCKIEHVRQMPGRIIGRTVDTEGKPGFVLTLQAREQHIRRSKATSNICTNQGLMVTAATIHMSIMGAAGLEHAAGLCARNTQILVDKLSGIGLRPLFRGGRFHEVTIKLSQPVGPVLEKMAAHGILGGYDLKKHYPELGETLLVCATETKTEADLEAYVTALAQALQAS
ncbi:MAG: aminomethyl-transferring glycine dehydrogenase subunit GcvPA [Pseudomonadota bacterium]